MIAALESPFVVCGRMFRLKCKLLRRKPRESPKGQLSDKFLYSGARLLDIRLISGLHSRNPTVHLAFELPSGLNAWRIRRRRCI
jgi:hypothetical protein